MLLPCLLQRNAETAQIDSQRRLKIQALILRLGEDLEPKVHQRSLAALSQLALLDEGTRADIAAAGAIPVLVKFLDPMSPAEVQVGCYLLVCEGGRVLRPGEVPV